MKTSLLSVTTALSLLPVAFDRTALAPPVASPAPSLRAPNANAMRVQVTIENLAPATGTFQTPVWVGLHDGIFDIYDRQQPASLFFPQTNALERLAEDGSTAEITQAFAQQSPLGVDDTLAGAAGAIAPGETVVGSFVVDPLSASTRYFSYASMVIPSNDFFIANGSPLAHPIFDDQGNFIADDFIVAGSQVLDAGTEVNDEVPLNTAFFGQQTPNTGVDEFGTVIGLAEGLQGFRAPGGQGILDDPRFDGADFLEAGYPVVRISFRAAPAFVEPLLFDGSLSGDAEVPPVSTPASGNARVGLVQDGALLRFDSRLRNLENVVMAHLHLGPVGQNGPVVAEIVAPREPGSGPVSRIRGRIVAGDLTGPLQGQPLDALVAEIANGNVYVNIHTDDGIAPSNTGPGDFASGELRAQLSFSSNMGDSDSDVSFVNQR